MYSLIYPQEPTSFHQIISISQVLRTPALWLGQTAIKIRQLGTEINGYFVNWLLHKMPLMPVVQSVANAITYGTEIDSYFAGMILATKYCQCLLSIFHNPIRCVEEKDSFAIPNG